MTLSLCAVVAGCGVGAHRHPGSRAVQRALYERSRAAPVPQRYYLRVGAQLSYLLHRYSARVAPGTYYSSTLAALTSLRAAGRSCRSAGTSAASQHPHLPSLQHDIATGWVRTFLLPLAHPNHDPRILWIIAHCRRFAGPARRDPIELALYRCPAKPHGVNN